MVSYEQIQETLALLKILALGNQQIENGRLVEAEQAFKKIRKNRIVG